MFDAFVAFRARLDPNAPAVMTPERIVSYADLDADVQRLAGGLHALGLTRASGFVAIRTGDRYLDLALLLAAARLGVATTAAHDQRADLRLGVRGGGEFRLTADWFNAVLSALPGPVPLPSRPHDEVGRVLLSSGTTREPRRTGLTWGMIEGNVRSAAVTYGSGKAGRWAPLTGLDSVLGFNAALTAFAVGAAVVLGWSPEALAIELEIVRPTLIALTPFHLHALLTSLPARAAHLDGLRLGVGGGAMSPALALEARLRLTHDVVVIYGATECSAAAIADASILESIPGAVGHPPPGVRVEIIGEDGAPVAPGGIGEVRVSGARVATAYIGDPQASAEAFRHGGFYPGDLGRLTADGALVIEGRADDRMNLGGFKIMPAVVEEAALACPGVEDAAAFAVPDDAGIEHCWLAVARGTDFDRQRLVDHLAAWPAELPELRFAWVQALPRNAMGKIERRRLRQETMAATGHGVGGG